LEVTELEASWQQRPVSGLSLSGVLTPEECAAVRADALATGLQRALVRDGERMRRSWQRNSDMTRLPRIAEREWLYRRIEEFSRKANSVAWHFDLSGVEDLQVLRYRPMQRFAWHLDTFVGSTRKLTCVVNLSSPDEYWRGGLEIVGAADGSTPDRTQGAGMWFPPYLLHRAKAPLRGERWVLVGWLTGRPFV